MSHPMIKHNNGRLSTTGLCSIAPTPLATQCHPRRRQITTFSVIVLELYETLRFGEKFRNFTELYNGSGGWNGTTMTKIGSRKSMLLNPFSVRFYDGT